MRIKSLLLATCVIAWPAAAKAQETTTYMYDALGRLVATSTSGGPNNGLNTGLSYDPAGNRTNQTVSGASGSPPPTPTPTPPPPTNQPPIANGDFLTAPKCVARSVNVIANDTDPDGHYPLVLTAVDQPWAFAASSSNIGMQTPDTNGVYTITYTVTDSLGATATGTLTVTVSGSQQCV